MLNQKFLLSVIGVLISIIVIGFTYTNYKIKNKEKEIQSLNISITNKNLEIQSLLLDKRITEETKELGIKLTNGIIVGLSDNDNKYTDLNDRLYKSIETLDKEDSLGISTSIIDSIWTGYEDLK